MAIKFAVITIMLIIPAAGITDDQIIMKTGPSSAIDLDSGERWSRNGNLIWGNQSGDILLRQNNGAIWDSNTGTLYTPTGNGYIGTDGKVILKFGDSYLVPER